MNPSPYFGHRDCLHQDDPGFTSAGEDANNSMLRPAGSDYTWAVSRVGGPAGAEARRFPSRGWSGSSPASVAVEINREMVRADEGALTRKWRMTA